MGEATDRLMVKLGSRYYVPPHVKVVNGKSVRVDGYWASSRGPQKKIMERMGVREGTGVAVEDMAAGRMQKKPKETLGEREARQDEDFYAQRNEAMAHSLDAYQKPFGSRTDRVDSRNVRIFIGSKVRTKDGAGQVVGQTPAYLLVQTNKKVGLYKGADLSVLEELDRSDIGVRAKLRMKKSGFPEPDGPWSLSVEEPEDWLELGRKYYVPPHVKVVAGKSVQVDGYWAESRGAQKKAMDAGGVTFRDDFKKGYGAKIPKKDRTNRRIRIGSVVVVEKGEGSGSVGQVVGQAGLMVLVRDKKTKKVSSYKPENLALFGDRPLKETG